MYGLKSPQEPNSRVSEIVAIDGEPGSTDVSGGVVSAIADDSATEFHLFLAARDFAFLRLEAYCFLSLCTLVDSMRSTYGITATGRVNASAHVRMCNRMAPLLTSRKRSTVHVAANLVHVVSLHSWGVNELLCDDTVHGILIKIEAISSDFCQ